MDLLFDPLWDSFFLLGFFEDPPTNGLAAAEAERETTAKLAASSFLFSAARHHAHLCENLCPLSGKKNKKTKTVGWRSPHRLKDDNCMRDMTT